MDELVSDVSEKWFKRRVWTAQCRHTRQIVAFVIGDRSETTARKLWQALPESYRACPVFTDEFNVYPLPRTRHALVYSSAQSVDSTSITYHVTTTQFMVVVIWYVMELLLHKRA